VTLGVFPALNLFQTVGQLRDRCTHPKPAFILNQNRTVQGKTGLTGKYDFSRQWTPGEDEDAMFKTGSQPAADGAQPPDSSAPSIFTALQGQLGLQLEPQQVPMKILVIDQVEKP
jgi:uncharacterized protein (TIGR03435 family)